LLLQLATLRCGSCAPPSVISQPRIYITGHGISSETPAREIVARALTLAGRPVHFVTIARWKTEDWRPVTSDHPLEVARSQLETVEPLVSGNPETTLEDLIDDPAHSEFDELTDGEVLRRAARDDLQEAEQRNKALRT
jgi:hypothetical protein